MYCRPIAAFMHLERSASQPSNLNIQAALSDGQTPPGSSAAADDVVAESPSGTRPAGLREKFLRFATWGMAPGALLIILALGFARHPQSASALEFTRPDPDVTAELRAMARAEDTYTVPLQIREPRVEAASSTATTAADRMKRLDRPMLPAAN